MASILLIEDNPIDAALTETILKNHGFEVECAFSSEQALRTLRGGQFDVILCDILLPDSNGFEFLSDLQKSNENRLPVFIFISSKDSRDSIIEGMRLGADDYVIKPVNQSELIQLIRFRLNRLDRSCRTTKANFDESIAPKRILVPNGKEILFIPIDDIIYCNAQRSYCSFTLKSGKLIVASKPMKEYEQLLLANKLVKVHKSYIVNPKFASSYLNENGGELVMSDGSSISVAASRKKEVIRAISMVV